MAWEWVAPVCSAGGAVLGAGLGALTTWLVGKGTRDHAARLARVERQQQRKAEAYVELLELLEHIGQWQWGVQPMIDFGEPKHPLPEADRQARMRALVTAYGSTELKQLHASYHATIQSIISTARNIDLARDNSHFNEPELRLKLEAELRPAERRIREQIGDVVANELRAGG